MKFHSIGREIGIVVCFIMQIGEITVKMLSVHFETLVSYLVEETTIIIQFILHTQAESEITKPYIRIGDFSSMIIGGGCKRTFAQSVIVDVIVHVSIIQT